MPSPIEFDKEDAAQLLSGDELGSATVDASPVSLDLKPNLGIDGADVSVALGASLAVQAFNSPDDADTDGVLLPESAPVAGVQLPRMVTLTSDGAWLKYRLEGRLKATVKASLADAGFDVDASAGVVLADYRFHARTDRVRDAVLADLRQPPRTALALSDVSRLAPGDALMFQTRGTLTAKVTVAFTDLFTAQATALLQLAGVAGSIAIKATAGASVGFTVRVADEFLVSFARVDAATWRAGVRKARSRQVGATLAATFEVGATNPRELAAFLGAVKDALVGHPFAQARRLLEKASLGDLSDAQQAIARRLLDRFGLSGPLATIEALKERLEAIDKGVDAALQQVAQAKVKLGFAYEYARIREDVELFQARLDSTRLQALHGDLARGRLVRALEALAAGDSGLALETYLNQQTMKRERSWGFTLGIGPWVTLGGKDTDSLLVIKRRNVEGRVQESYLGARGYEGRWIGETFKWSADFKADMRGYSQATVAVLPEFDLGLHLAFASRRRKLSAGDIDDYLDFASLWQIVGDADRDERRAELMEMKGRDLEMAIQLTVGDEAFKLMLPLVAGAADADLAGALAAAMPRHQTIHGLRSVAERVSTYRAIWHFCLTHPQASREELRARAGSVLQAAGNAVLASFERSSDPNHPLFGFTLTSRVALDGEPLGPWRQFRNGAALLHQGPVSGGAAETTLDRARKNMQACWTQVHRLRAIGAFLVDTAARAGVLAKVGRSFTVTPASEKARAKDAGAMVVVA
jgi:hypothetical protein